MYIYLSMSLVTTIFKTGANTTVQVYGRAITNITCTATTPSFLLNDTYNSFEYDQFPHLFGITVDVSLSGNEVTLIINGTAKSSNLEVVCKNITDPILGVSMELFQLVLNFQGELVPWISCYTCTHALSKLVLIHTHTHTHTHTGPYIA